MDEILAFVNKGIKLNCSLNGSFGLMVKAILSDLPDAMTKTTEFEFPLTLKK